MSSPLRKDHAEASSSQRIFLDVLLAQSDYCKNKYWRLNASRNSLFTQRAYATPLNCWKFLKLCCTKSMQGKPTLDGFVIFSQILRRFGHNQQRLFTMDNQQQKSAFARKDGCCSQTNIAGGSPVHLTVRIDLRYSRAD